MRGKYNRIAAVMTVLFFASIFISLTQPLIDPDLWWHLASGRWITEHSSLMQEDPFNFTSSERDPVSRRDFILKQYWLSQLIIYASYTLYGFKGIVLLRASVLALMFFVLYTLIRRQGAGRALSAMLVLASLYVIAREFHYYGERPQMFTSLFSVLAIYLLQGQIIRRRWAYFALPAMMLIWANMHGGFVLGSIIILIYLSVSIISKMGHRGLYASGIASLALSLANPNLHHAYLATAATLLNVQTVSYGEAIVETQSIFGHAGISGSLKALPVFSSMLVLSAVLVISRLKFFLKSRPETLVLYILGLVMGIKAIRYAAFFSAVAPFAMSISISSAMDAIKGRLPYLRTPAWISNTATLIIVAFITILISTSGIRSSSLKYKVDYSHPYDGSVNFMLENGLKGNIMNDYNEGGYLIWRLSPTGTKVFADGRAVSLAGFELFRQVSGFPYTPVSKYDATALYKRVLDYYGADIAILPGCDRVSGVVILLSLALIKDNLWSIVYVDSNAIVFMRNDSVYSEFVQSRRLPKTSGYDNILSMAYAASIAGHTHKAPRLSLSFAIGYAGKGQKENALYWLNQYMSRYPDDPMAQKLLIEVQNM